MEKITGNEPINARPISHNQRPDGGYPGDYVEYHEAQNGLTIRQHFAAMAMQGMLAQSNGNSWDYDISALTTKSVNCADALITALNQQ